MQDQICNRGTCSHPCGGGKQIRERALVMNMKYEIETFWFFKWYIRIIKICGMNKSNMLQKVCIIKFKQHLFTFRKNVMTVRQHLMIPMKGIINSNMF